MDAALVTTWELYRAWARQAAAVRASMNRWRSCALILTVLGAFLSTLSAQHPGWLGDAPGVTRALSAAGAVAMALATWTAASLLDADSERNWIRARGLAERAKSECYRYAMRLSPYSDADAAQKLLAIAQTLLADGADLRPPDRPDPNDDANGNPPLCPMSIDEFIAIRIDGQIKGYYDLRASLNARRAAQCKWLVLILSGIGTICGALGAIYTRLGIEAWVATFSAVSTAVGSYALAQRFQRLAVTYRIAAERLAMRLAQWRVTTQSKADPAADEALVQDTEAILGGENQAWVADFLKQPVRAGAS